MLRAVSIFFLSVKASLKSGSTYFFIETDVCFDGQRIDHMDFRGFSPPKIKP